MSYILLTWLLAPIWWPIAWLRRSFNRQLRRVVVFEIAGIGDVVCSAHLFAQLRQRYPKAIIDLVVDPVAASLAPALPMVDRVIQFSYAQQRGFMGRLRLAILCAGYDTGICLIPSAAQLTAFCLAAMPWRLSVLPSPLNQSYRCLRPLMTDVAIHQPGEYFANTQGHLLAHLGLKHIDFSKQLLPIASVATGFLDIARLTMSVGLLVGSGRPLKRLDPVQMQALITGLINLSPNVGVVLLGGPADKDSAKALMQNLPPEMRQRIDDATGSCTLAELPARLAQLKLLIGVDSGVTHMADALNVPVICIAGPVDLHEVYEPGQQRVLLSSQLPCHPCSRVFDTPASCHLGHKNCLRQLDIADVILNARRLLDIGHA